jgi:hypothetical protein
MLYIYLSHIFNVKNKGFIEDLKEEEMRGAGRIGCPVCRPIIVTPRAKGLGNEGLASMTGNFSFNPLEVIISILKHTFMSQLFALVH